MRAGLLVSFDPWGERERERERERETEREKERQKEGERERKRVGAKKSQQKVSPKQETSGIGKLQGLTAASCYTLARLEHDS